MTEVLVKFANGTYEVDYYAEELGMFTCDAVCGTEVIGWREIHESQ